MSAHLIIDSGRQANRNPMITTIARSVAGIETQQILVFQVFFDRLKDRRQVNVGSACLGHQRLAGVAGEEIFASSFFGEFAETLCGRAHYQPSVARLEKW